MLHIVARTAQSNWWLLHLVGRSPSHSALANERLAGLILQSFAQSDRAYGSPRVWRDLIDWGEAVGENRVAQLMHKRSCKRVTSAGDCRH